MVDENVMNEDIIDNGVSEGVEETNVESSQDEKVEE